MEQPPNVIWIHHGYGRPDYTINQFYSELATSGDRPRSPMGQWRRRKPGDTGKNTGSYFPPDAHRTQNPVSRNRIFYWGKSSGVYQNLHRDFRWIMHRIYSSSCISGINPMQLLSVAESLESIKYRIKSCYRRRCQLLPCVTIFLGLVLIRQAWSWQLADTEYVAWLAQAPRRGPNT